ncbi:acid protease [Sodiomyces alkalinus F11]|uniref:Acid protease n=1 Tax=Sodiomyces alkalinus (strain CBS 110278 / VKM F-3762 / F11) TaxID=1314773 RepID=A0A3N2PUF9_SODAK|nr:acid protease [Sodiomyces alkalinus F11]ROT38130.1 acid protease [Sodiomyces alkalinus F11]
MQYLTLLLAVTLSVCCTLGSAVERESTVPEGVIKLPLRSRVLSDDKFRKRSSASCKPPGYEAAVEIGTPRQPLWLPIGLSSNNLWTTPLCTFYEEYYSGRNYTGKDCSDTQAGLYNPHGSSTSRNVSTAFLTAEREMFLRLWAFEDDVWIDGHRIQKAQFGLNQKPGDDLSVGSLELGLSIPRGRGRHDGVLGGLLSSGDIQNLTFSLSIGAAMTQNEGAIGEGELVFGGVDIRKNHGELHRLPLSSIWETAFGLSYCVELNTILFLTTSKSQSLTLTGPEDVFGACLDTTSTFTELPDAPFHRLLEFFPEAELAGDNLYSVPCQYANIVAHVRFGFGDGVYIDVPYGELVLQPNRFTEDGPGYCVLGITRSRSTGYARLGETFLRSATAL